MYYAVKENCIDRPWYTSYYIKYWNYQRSKILLFNLQVLLKLKYYSLYIVWGICIELLEQSNHIWCVWFFWFGLCTSSISKFFKTNYLIKKKNLATKHLKRNVKIYKLLRVPSLDSLHPHKYIINENILHYIYPIYLLYILCYSSASTNCKYSILI